MKEASVNTLLAKRFLVEKIVYEQKLPCSIPYHIKTQVSEMIRPVENSLECVEF